MSFDEQLVDLWMNEFLGPMAGVQHGVRHCGLCGNSGVIDTCGKVFTSNGTECGMIAFCICPNGRIRKYNGDRLQP